MKILSLTVMLALAGTSVAFGAGDIEKGKKDFKKCKACHQVVSPTGEKIVRGGKTGPNLYGVIGRVPGSVEGYKYSESLKAFGDTGQVWDEALLMEFVANPKAFLKEKTGDSSARSKMTFKWKKSENVAAFLASLSE